MTRKQLKVHNIKTKILPCQDLYSSFSQRGTQLSKPDTLRWAAEKFAFETSHVSHQQQVHANDRRSLHPRQFEILNLEPGLIKAAIRKKVVLMILIENF